MNYSLLWFQYPHLRRKMTQLDQITSRPSLLALISLTVKEKQPKEETEMSPPAIRQGLMKGT